MAYTQQLAKFDKKTLETVNDIIKTLSTSEEQYEEFWTTISSKPFKSFKSNKKPRSKSGYYVFSSDVDIRNKIKKENPEQAKNIGFISKKISELWKNISNEEKSVYITKAEELNIQLKTETESRGERRYVFTN